MMKLIGGCMEKVKEIERSIIKTYRKNIWAPFIRALKEYQLIQENDRICVCISGGKDSFLLAKLFQELHRHSDFAFELEFIVMNPGYNEENLNMIKENLKLLEIPAQIYDSDIFEIANKQIKSPCYLCAKMRRGVLYNIAAKLGCNKIALGHHYDDVIETTLMNMLYSGSYQTMMPKLLSTSHPGMELIRPLYFIREKDIINWKNKNDLTFLQCACKLTSLASNDLMASQRKETKALIKRLEKYNPLVAKNIFASSSNVNLDKLLGYNLDGKRINYLDQYYLNDDK
jgi:tRNA(Ile)-lysidine synthase TilS/MesJ